MTSRSSTSRRGLLAATVLLAAPAAGAQQRPAARPLGAAVATSEALVALSAVRQLPGGRVLVNDPGSRRVLLMDSLLNVLKVVADSTPSTANAYGPAAGGLIAYRGDSTLFVDPASLSMLVIDPNGDIARVMAAPRPNDVPFLVGGPLGTAAFDARGRLVYRTRMRNLRGAPPAPGQLPSFPPEPDSAPVLRYDLASRTLDTALFVKVNPLRMQVTQSEGSITSMSSITHPMPVVDDWTVLSDGSIAVVRGKDYHLDVFGTDGARSSGEKLAFDWQRLTDDDKVRIIDSVKAAVAAARAAGSTGGIVLNGTPSGIVGAAAGGGGGGGGGGEMRIVMSTTIDGGPAGAPRAQAGGTPSLSMQAPPPIFVQPNELPDYRPAFAAGSARADRDGHVWVRTIPTKPLAAGPEYDVLDRAGRLVERVAIPKGTTIVGFGDGGIVYLGVRDAAGTHLVRARVR